jgi:hypothetical protein
MKPTKTPKPKTPAEQIADRIDNLEPFVRIASGQVRSFGDQLPANRLANVAQLVMIADEVIMGLYSIFMDVAQGSGGDIERNPSLQGQAGDGKAVRPGDAAEWLLVAGR